MAQYFIITKVHSYFYEILRLKNCFSKIKIEFKNNSVVILTPVEISIKKVYKVPIKANYNKNQSLLNEKKIIFSCMIYLKWRKCLVKMQIQN